MIGKTTKIHAMTFIGPDVTIGERCSVQAFAFIPDNVLIGDDVFIGPHVCFTNDKYPPSHGGWKQTPPTVVEDGVSIGAGAVILPSLTLGIGCRIGAGSVVTKSVSPGRLVIGNPAVEVKDA